jgi:hypothetical protein
MHYGSGSAVGAGFFHRFFTAGFDRRRSIRAIVEKVGIRLPAVVLLALAAAVSAQALDGASVRGRVTDPDGLPLPGVVITLAPSVPGPATSVVTDDAGSYAIDAPPGSYRLKAELSGFEAHERPVSLVAGEAVELDFGMHLAAFQAQVSVKADAPRPVLGAPTPDAPVVATRAVVDAGMLPNSQYDDVLPLLPNVVRGPDGLISVAGANAPQGGLLVNGVNLADPISGQAAMMLPLEAIDSVEVFSGAYPAAAGRATGGVTWVHTRSGGDAWHASANSIFPRLLILDGKLHGVEYWEPNVGLSGPIVKGRLYVAEGLSYRYDRNHFDTVAGQQINHHTAVMSWTQLDMTVSTSQHLAVAVSFDPQRTDRADITAFTAPGSVPRLDSGGWSASVSDHLTLGGSATLELRAAVVRSSLLVVPEGDAPYEVAHDLTRGSFFDRRDLDGLRTETAAVWSWTAPRGHQVEAGVSVGRIAIDGVQAAGTTDYLRSDGTPSLRITFQPSNSPVSDYAYETGLFVQDRWTASPRVTVDAGVRFDRVSSVRPAASPRAAATVKLPGGDTTLTGSVGLFADKVPLEALAFPQGQARLVQVWDEAGVPGLARLFTNQASGPLATPLATRWDVEIARRFGGGWQGRVKYQERRGRDELVVNPVVTSDTAGLLELSSTGVSRARSVEATVAFRSALSGHEFYVSYVRAATSGNMNTLDTVEGASRMPLVLPDQVAPLRADVPNRVLAWGMLHFPRRITIAPFVEIRDGFPYSPIQDNWNYAGPAGSGRLPWFGSLDLYAYKVFTVLPRLPDARIGVKFYNLASVHTERDIQLDVARPDFGTTYNPIPRDVSVVMELLWGRK